MIGLSGTWTIGLSGTRSSDYREPEPVASHRDSWTFYPRNLANKESFGFLLTAPRQWDPGCSAPSDTRIGMHVATSSLTHVTLVWQKGVREDWLRFGTPVGERVIDRRRRVESYAPGQVFALVRWAANGYGTVRSSLAIVRAVGPHESYATLAQVDPGGDLLLWVNGWGKVRRVLGLIDAIANGGTDPCEVAPDHWRHMHNRLAAGMPPRCYGTGRHRAWLQRRGLRL